MMDSPTRTKPLSRGLQEENRQSYGERENCSTYENERVVNMTDLKKDQGEVEKEREEECVRGWGGRRRR